MKSLAVIVAFVFMVLFAGCGSTVITRSPDGTVTEINAGFGNRIEAPPVTIEPSGPVVEAGERVGTKAIEKATDRMVEKAIESFQQRQATQAQAPP